MPIITISRGSYSRGKEVAEKVASKLNYDCISRDVLLEASTEFNIPEIKLVRALHDAPSVLERFKHGKDRYLSYYRYALLKHVRQDNIVYHGLAGHFMLCKIPHVLKVRIIANMDDRVREEMKRENISAEKALYILKKDDAERRKWGLEIHGHDTWDSRLYDMVLHINPLTVDDAVQIICDTAQKPQFQATDESRRLLNEMTMSAQIQAKLVSICPRANVVIEDDVAYINAVGEELKALSAARDRVRELVLEVEGINSVSIQELPAAKPGYINPYHNI